MVYGAAFLPPRAGAHAAFAVAQAAPARWRGSRRRLRWRATLRLTDHGDLTELDVMRTEYGSFRLCGTRELTSVALGSLDADAGMCVPLTAGDRKYWGRTSILRLAAAPESR